MAKNGNKKTKQKQKTKKKTISSIFENYWVKIDEKTLSKINDETNSLLVLHGLDVGNSLCSSIKTEEKNIVLAKAYYLSSIVHALTRDKDINTVLKLLSKDIGIGTNYFDKIYKFLGIFSEIVGKDESEGLGTNGFFDRFSGISKEDELYFKYAFLLRVFDLTKEETFNMELRKELGREIKDKENFAKSIIYYYYPFAELLGLKDADLIRDRGVKILYPIIYSNASMFRKTNYSSFERTLRKAKKYIKSVLDQNGLIEGTDYYLKARIKSIASATLKIIHRKETNPSYTVKDIPDWIGISIVLTPKQKHTDLNAVYKTIFTLLKESTQLNIVEMENHYSSNRPYNAIHLLASFKKDNNKFEIQITDKKSYVENMLGDASRLFYKSKGNIVEQDLSLLLNGFSDVLSVLPSMALTKEEQEVLIEVYDIKQNKKRATIIDSTKTTLVADLLVMLGELGKKDLYSENKKLSLTAKILPGKPYRLKPSNSRVSRNTLKNIYAATQYDSTKKYFEKERLI